MNNISGNRYGKLTALEFPYMKNSHPFWKCKKYEEPEDAGESWGDTNETDH